MATDQKASIIIQAYDKASYAVLGVAANLETLNKRMARTSQVGFAFNQLGQQLAPTIGRIQNMGVAWGSAIRRLSLLGITAGGAAAGMASFAKSTADSVDKIGDLSGRYQIATKTLQVYGSMLEDSGASMDDTAAAMGKLKKAMNEAVHGDKEAAAAFDGVGISVAKLKKMKIEEVMLAMADGFKDSTRDGEKQAVLLKLMGKNGTIFMDTMNKGGEGYRERLKEMIADGAILDGKQVSFADRFTIRWARMQRTMGALRMRIGMQLAERLEPLLIKFQNWLSGDGGKKLSEQFSRIFTTENIQLFVDTLMAVGKVLMSLARGFKNLVEAIGPANTIFLGLAFLLAPVIGAFLKTGSALWGISRAAIAVAGAFPGITLAAIAAGLAIAGAFKIYEEYKALSESSKAGAEEAAIRKDKRAAYDRVLQGVGGEALIKNTRNADFQQLDNYVNTYERSGLVAKGTAAKLAAMPVDVQGKIAIEVTAKNLQAKVTEIKKSGGVDLQVQTGLQMAGG